MKKLFAVLFLTFFVFSAAFAQRKRDREIIQIKANVECQACQKIIERYFQREPGIINLHVFYRKNLIRATYKPSRTTPSRIRTAIANLGFNADTVKANPYYAKRLPPCCRQKEEKEEKKTDTMGNAGKGRL